MILAAIGITAISLLAYQDAYNAGITLSPDERAFAVGNASRVISLFRLADGKPLRTFAFDVGKFMGDHLTKPVFLPDGKWITAASLAADGSVNPVWRVRDGKLVTRYGLWKSSTEAWQLSTLGCSGDTKWILGRIYSWGRLGGQLVALEAGTGRVVYVEQHHDLSDVPDVVAVSPKGSLVAYKVSGIANVFFWDPTAETGTCPWNGPNSSVKGDVDYVTFSGDGNWLLLARENWWAGHYSKE